MKVLLIAAAVVLLGACSSGGPKPAAAPAVSRDDVCVEVNAGVAAFNAGDYPTTVEHFVAAVPLARAADEAAPSTDSADLLAAVRYYAGLVPQDYPVAATTSADFARYKDVTLSQCQPDGTPAQPTDKPVQA